MSIPSVPTLTQLLDRLCELRPDWRRCRPEYHEEGYELIDGDERQFFVTPKLEKRGLSRLKGAIERLIESRINDESNWYGYGSGCTQMEGHHAWILPGKKLLSVEYQKMPNQAIALLSCLIAALEQEDADAPT